jgi:toxin FitB
MPVAELLVDTDVFVDHLRGSRALAPGGDAISYSAITRAELFAGPPDQEGAVRQLLAPFAEIDVDRAVAEAAGRIRRASGARMPDALIAATALAHGLVLLTRNVRDFERVDGLRVREPA